ncbi:Rap1a/Tai family immunity protein [Pseudomonas syringae]|uniref:Rap1a/Tai family immunity protein n=1 Tax=Pseudomonas syringae TaxID=317 RepID=UPI0011D08356|nr:Rap1a/Tai family immunity protein [Pseudomonas syringae]
MKSVLLLGMLTFWWAGYAIADGNALLKQCQSAQQLIDGNQISSTYDAGECIGTLQATVDTLEIARHTFSNDKNKPLAPLICWPSNKVIPKTQGLRIVIKYLEQHPQELHLNGSTLAVLALAGAFPCK